MTTSVLLGFAVSLVDMRSIREGQSAATGEVVLIARYGSRKGLHRGQEQQRFAPRSESLV
jgi:hypothetical protein